MQDPKLFKISEKDKVHYKKLINNSIPGIYKLRLELINNYRRKKKGDLPIYEKYLSEIRRILIETITGSANIHRILCEKPLALDLPETNNILELCKSKKIDLKMNFQRRHLPSFKSVNEVLGDLIKLTKHQINNRIN